MVDSVTPYSTAMKFLTGAPKWLNEYDAERLASYDLYDDIYHGTPDAFKVMIRGSDANPIYIPSAKQIINTMGRYTGRGWGFSLDPAMGSETEQADAITAYGTLFNREKFLARFASSKRFGLIRGDWCFMIMADPLKPEGRRISLRAVDPRTVFPIFDEIDPELETGVDIVEQFINPADNKTYLRRQRWLKPSHPLHPNTGKLAAPIAYETAVLQMKDWENPKKASVFKMEQPMALLDPLVTALPVYRLKNNEEPGNPWGSSELRGMERIMAGINQAVTDEDLHLALSGLGVYATDGGAPVDENGNTTDWDLSPGTVVELATGAKFDRVTGISSVNAFQEHLAYLEKQLFRSSGISDVALGQVDVSVAESGIALALRMGPLLDAAEEKDLDLSAVMGNMLFDLRSWFQAYEGINMANVSVLSTLGDKLPVDRAARFKELMDLLTAELVTKEFVLERLTKEFGYEFPKNMLQELEQAAADAQAAADPYADRLSDPDDESEVVDPAEDI